MRRVGHVGDARQVQRHEPLEQTKAQIKNDNVTGRVEKRKLCPNLYLYAERRTGSLQTGEKRLAREAVRAALRYIRTDNCQIASRG
jgi:hypothetical protein